MNSRGVRFVPPKEMAIERPTPPWGRFTTIRENDASKSKECSSRNKDFSPRGKITPPNDKVVGKVTVQGRRQINLFFQGRELSANFQ